MGLKVWQGKIESVCDTATINVFIAILIPWSSTRKIRLLHTVFILFNELIKNIRN